MRIETIRPSELGPVELERWAELRASDPCLASPYFAPEWSLWLDGLRPDIRVAVLLNADRIDAFLPVQRASSYAALAPGGPLCDYQGLIARPDLEVDLRRFAMALKVGRIDFTHALAHQTALGPVLRGEDASQLVDLSGGWDSYREQRRAAGSSVGKRIRQRRNKLEREVGPVRMTAFSADMGDYHQMIAWKRAQMHRTSVPDIFAHDWVSRLVHRTADARTGTFGGALFSLHAGDRLIAVHHCLRSEKVLHSWFIGHDPAFEAYSPGLILTEDVLRTAAETGYREVDFGAGDYQFKRSFSNASRATGHGFAGLASAAALVRGAEWTVRRVAEAMPMGKLSALPAKAMRRLDLYRGLSG